MIYLTKKDPDRTRFVLNHRIIERMEERESTVLLLENGKTYIVDEGVDEIIQKVIAFEGRILLHREESERDEGIDTK